MTSMDDEKKKAWNNADGWCDFIYAHLFSGREAGLGDSEIAQQLYGEMMERKALSPTPPPVDGELAKALLWLENTKRHLDEQGRMEEMLYCEALLQAATSQQAREWTVEELLKIMFPAMVEARLISNGFPNIDAPPGDPTYEPEALAVIKVLAAKNIIRLKDGGAE